MSVLAECAPPRPGRRWFADEDFDLVVWLAPDETVTGFQLCWDRATSERALTWTAAAGFTSHRVDDGEASPAKNRTPILVPEGDVPVEEILPRLSRAAAGLDPALRDFVLATLRAHPARRA